MSFAMATVRYAGMTRFVVTAKHSSQSCRRSGRAYCRRPFVIYRAVLRRVQPAPALRCPQGAIFNIGTRAAAKDRGQHEGAADLPQIICHHALSFWINRRAIELFCAQVFGIRKGRSFAIQRSRQNTRDQLSGAASRGARITRPTVERLTPIFRASSFCVAFGFAATSLAIFAHTPAGRRGRPMVSRPPLMQ